MRLAAFSLLLLTGCARKPIVVAVGPTRLQVRAAAFADIARDTLKTYRADVKAAKYEQEEIGKVQSDLDAFDLHVGDAGLWLEIDQLVADLEAMVAQDDMVYKSYIL